VHVVVRDELLRAAYGALPESPMRARQCGWAVVFRCMQRVFDAGFLDSPYMMCFAGIFSSISV